jgi:hypothetical protein
MRRIRRQGVEVFATVIAKHDTPSHYSKWYCLARDRSVSMETLLAKPSEISAASFAAAFSAQDSLGSFPNAPGTFFDAGMALSG